MKRLNSEIAVRRRRIGYLVTQRLQTPQKCGTEGLDLIILRNSMDDESIFVEAPCHGCTARIPKFETFQPGVRCREQYKVRTARETIAKTWTYSVKNSMIVILIDSNIVSQVGLIFIWFFAK